jgi:hypothetical protein
MFETIPKLRDERQTFQGRQTNNLIASEQHAFQPAKKRAGEQGLRNAGPVGAPSTGKAR